MNLTLILEVATRFFLLGVYVTLLGNTPVIREVQQTDWPLYNYQQSGSSRVSMAILNILIVSYCVGLGAICGLCSFFQQWRRLQSSSSSKSSLRENSALWLARPGLFFKQQFILYLAITVALLLTGILTIFLKNLVGRPRPDFLSRCQPKGFDRSNPDFSQLALIPDCSNLDVDSVLEGRRSFPSGHSSYSFCIAVFAALFIHQIALRPYNNVIGPGVRLTISLAVLCPAIYTASSRLIDYKHHWDDILSGSALGAVIAAMCFKHYYRQRKPVRHTELLSHRRTRPSMGYSGGSYSDVDESDDTVFRTRKWSKTSLEQHQQPIGSPANCVIVNSPGHEATMKVSAVNIRPSTLSEMLESP